MVDNVPTYDLFLRVAKVADGTGSAASSMEEKSVRLMLSLYWSL